MNFVRSVKNNVLRPRRNGNSERDSSSSGGFNNMAPRAGESQEPLYEPLNSVTSHNNMSRKFVTSGSGIWDDRCHGHDQGRAYYCPEDVVQIKPTATKVGVAYQISQLCNIDVVNECFQLGWEMSMIYKVPDEDYEKYQKAVELRTGLEELASLTGEDKLTVAPPMFTIRNEMESVETLESLISWMRRLYDPDTKQWAWYATTYARYRGILSEGFDLRRFPYCRQVVHVSWVCKWDTAHYIFVPWNDMIPHFEHSAKTGRVTNVGFRANTWKAPSRFSNSWEIQNHYMQFLPMSLVPQMPSGARYARFQLALLVEVSPNFYLYNVPFIIGLMTVLAVSAFNEPPDSTADRMSIVLTLILTLAAYKSAITSWLPVKPYLTYMDKYVILAFLMLVFLSVIITFNGFVIHYGNDFGIDKHQYSHESIRQVELTSAWMFLVSWVGAHVLAVVFHNQMFQSWESVIEAESQALIEERDSVQASTGFYKGFDRGSGPMPAPPGSHPRLDTQSFY